VLNALLGNFFSFGSIDPTSPHIYDNSTFTRPTDFTMTDTERKGSDQSVSGLEAVRRDPEISEKMADSSSSEVSNTSNTKKGSGVETKIETLGNDAVSTVSTHEKHTNFGFLPIPRNCQVSESKPFHFNMTICILFGIGSTFTVANLYYNQPILIHLSTDFNVPYDRISNVPSLTQAGYAGALLLISPLGDIVKRRPLILALCVIGAILSIGLATTNSLAAFEALSFLVGFSSVRVPSKYS